MRRRAASLSKISTVPSDHFVESRAVDGMPGRMALAKIDTVGRVNAILKGNIRQLSALIGKMQDPSFAFPVLDSRNPEAHDQFLGEFERLLHNALSAVKSRVDLLRTLVARYVADSAPELAAAYSARVAADFVTDPTHLFLTKLRDYALHVNLPAIVSSFKFSREEGESFNVLLRVEPLVEARDHFNATTRKWIEDQGEMFDIVQILNDYYARVVDFDRWFSKSIEQYHHREIVEYQQAARAFKKSGIQNHFSECDLAWLAPMRTPAEAADLLRRR